MNPDEVKAALDKKAGSAPAKKLAPKAPPKLMKKADPAGAPRVSGGNPFDGAREEMLEQMGGEMNPGTEISINGEPVTDPMQIAEVVVNNPEIMAAVQSLMQGGNASEQPMMGEDDDM